MNVLPKPELFQAELAGKPMLIQQVEKINFLHKGNRAPAPHVQVAAHGPCVLTNVVLSKVKYLQLDESVNTLYSMCACATGLLCGLPTDLLKICILGIFPCRTVMISLQKPSSFAPQGLVYLRKRNKSRN